MSSWRRIFWWRIFQRAQASLIVIFCCKRPLPLIVVCPAISVLQIVPRIVSKIVPKIVILIRYLWNISDTYRFRWPKVAILKWTIMMANSSKFRGIYHRSITSYRKILENDKIATFSRHSGIILGKGQSSPLFWSEHIVKIILFKNKFPKYENV